MEIQQNVSLRPFNTFGIDVPAAYYTEVHDLKDIAALAALRRPLHVLGGGSNVLLTGEVPGIVVRDCLKGISVLNEDEEHVWLEAAGGEIWHELVLYTIARGWGGLENLALIPGTVGAAPIQNIGAYGVEVKDTIEKVHFHDLEADEERVFSNDQCAFGYRDSIFKNELKGRIFITSVVFRLSKRPILNTSYGAIEEELRKMQIASPTVKDVAQAVISIRSSKLPDPKVVGNAGSFFKNPTISRDEYEALLAAHPGIPHFKVNADLVKVPAAWLIEQCGWKGYTRGDAGVHDRQALVLVNRGRATGSQLWQLSGDIVASVKERFGICLEREVQVW
ncbi:MAG: UDP-N-acetylmuramate dehydrogenase [Taibaiella sp.]|nr:UDP-N-acetylmuramate dehydrogenase [Taibaiella sp.]